MCYNKTVANLTNFHVFTFSLQHVKLLFKEECTHGIEEGLGTKTERKNAQLTTDSSFSMTQDKSCPKKQSYVLPTLRYLQFNREVLR